jgi:hypothetical protein
MRHRYLFLFFLIVFLHLFAVSGAQKGISNGASFGLQGHFGSFLGSEPKAQYLRDSYSGLGEVYYQQPVGPAGGSRRQPLWGLGLFHGNTGSRQYIGSMSGAYTFVQFPLLSAASFSSSLRIGGGLGWVQKPYDKNTNYKNVLIGSHLNGYMHLLWQAEYRLSGPLFLNAGLSFSHLSNGTATLPNLGLNIPAISLGLRYQLPRPLLPAGPVPAARAQGKSQIGIYTTVALKQYPWIGSKRYLLRGWSFRRSNVVGGGLSVFRNRSLEVDPASFVPAKRRGHQLQAGAYVSWEHTVGRVSLPLQLGTYVYNKDENPPLFQQIGLRYRISPRWRGQVLLKTHMGKADFIHAGIGYQLK